MQTVLGLVEDAAPRTVYDPGRDLLTPVRRQTVQEDGVFCGEGHYFLIDLVGGKLLLTLLGLGILSHTGPYVGVDDAGVRDGLVGVFGEVRGGAQRSCQLDYLSFRTVSFGVGDGEFCAAQGAGYGEGVGHVVAVADVRDPYALDRTELLSHGHEVGDGLARVVGVRESVYYGDVGRAGELFQVSVVEGADHDGVDVAGEDAARVGRRLAFADLDLLRAQMERVAA